MSSDTAITKAWRLHYDHYDPKDEGRREAVLALGNGYLVSRAAAPEAVDDSIHYPGTYRVGCYNRLATEIRGEEVENESLVNLPNWLPLTFRIEEGRWFSLDEVEILSYEQELDMRQASLHRNIHFRDREGKITKLREVRFVSMAQPHLMGLRLEIIPQNWSGTLEILSALDGSVVNNNVKRYAPYPKRHLRVCSSGRLNEEAIELKAQTLQSGIDIALAARTRLQLNGSNPAVKRVLDTSVKDRIAERIFLRAGEGESVVIEKLGVLYTSRDLAIANCCDAARTALKRAAGFDKLLAEHRCQWDQLWRRCQIEVDDPEQLLYFRLHIFQILQNISPHTADIDVGVPPSGWQGEEYGGQIFWDEVFVFQFISYRFPSIARALLLYRYRRLNEARYAAKERGYRGALFPWRSASTGREETPQFQLNLYNNQWLRDYTRYQRHIGAIIAYNLCHYLEITGDFLFMEDYGAELLLEIARFWSSIATYNPTLDRYEIKGVVGPDEYHTCYPGAEQPGIDNNTYTNVMAAWTIMQALEIFNRLSPQRREELCDMLALSREEFAHWREVSQKMLVVFQEDGVLSQFEGFHALQAFDLDQYREQYNHERIDWQLHAMGDQVERYQVSKQADTSMLLYLLSPAELISVFEQMGYTLTEEMLRKMLHFHLSHTMHESSLSRVVYAGAFALLDQEASLKLFEKAQQIDMIPGVHHDSSEGIHLGAMGGTLVILQHYYMGIRAQGDTLIVDPALPEKINRVRLSLYFREVALSCEANHSSVTLTSPHQDAPAVQVAYRGQTKTIKPGSSISFDLTEKVSQQ